MKKLHSLMCVQVLLAPLLILPILESSAFASVTLLDSDWKIKLGGFVEFDSITDSVRSFTEIIGNTPVDRPNTQVGANGRTQFSVRNTRLGISVEAPKIDNQISTRAYFEFDFLGYDPNPSNTAASVGTNEASFFNNPTLRTRHAYFQASTDTWEVLAGQTWQILGWQPYYFLNTVQVAPIPAMLYNREAQVRGTIKHQVLQEVGMQAVLGVMRPPQHDSSYPGLEGGIRFTYDGRKSGFNGGSTGALALQPMSIAVSGTFREFEMPTDTSGVDHADYPAGAVAVDGLLPLLASPDGKSTANTLTLVGEFSTGTGYGDEYNGWTGNIANPLNTATTKTNPPSVAGTLAAAGVYPNLDGGDGDYDPSGAFHLIHLTVWNSQLQYNLPSECHSWITAGYGQLFSNNLSLVQQASGFMSSGKVGYNREEIFFGNIFHDFTPQIRVGAEYAFIRTTYLDGVEAHDNRYQISAWYLF